MDATPTSLHTFLATHHRLPNLEDDPAPFSYRGWLLPYIVLAHDVIPETGNRWDYHLKLCEAETLPSDPIPRLTFEGAAHSATINIITKWIGIAERHGRSWDGFGDFVDWLAFGLGVSKEPSRLSPDIQTQLYREVGVHHLLQHPYDYLGEILATRKAKNWNPHAFFPTPPHVVEMMVHMTMDTSNQVELEQLRTRSCCDPCCGTGRMLLHASNYFLRLYGIDVDSLVCKIASINGALYAPWLSFPLPDRLFTKQKTPLPDKETLTPTNHFAIHQHQTYQAMTQTQFIFEPDEPVPA